MVRSRSRSEQPKSGLGTWLGNPAWEPLPGNLWEPCLLGNLFLETVGNLAWEPWEPCLGSLFGNLAWEPCLGTLLGNLWENLKDSFPRTGFQEQVSKSRFPNEVTKQVFPSKAPRNKFASKVSRHRCPSKVFLAPDRWSVKGLSRFISNSSQTSFRRTFVDFFM